MRRTEIEKYALQHSADLAAYSAIKAEIEKRIEAGELFEIERGRGPELTSNRIIDLQHDKIRSVETAKPGKVARQKTKKQKEIIRPLSGKEMRAAINQIIEQGHITEIVDRSEILKVMAGDCCSNPNTLVVCLRDDDRHEVNKLIQQRLQRDGRNKRKSIKTAVLVGRDLSEAQRTFAGAYQIGDIVRYYSGSKLHGIERGAYRQVIKVDQEQNTITVQTEKGKNKLTYDPMRLSGVRIYREETRQFSEGDKIQFCASFQEQRIATNEIGTITGIKGGKLTIKADKGRQVIVNVSSYRHLDFGYAVTSISAQGRTAYRVIFGADTTESSRLLDRRATYVANSRAIHGMHIYTNSIEELSAALDLKRDKNTAVKAVSETGQVKTGAKPAAKKRQRQAPQKERPASLELPREKQTQTSETVREAPRSESSQRPARTETREAASQLAQLIAEDGNKVRVVIMALAQIAGVSDELRRNPPPRNQDRAKEINTWVRHCSPTAKALRGIPGMPLDTEIKSRLTEALSSLHRMTAAYEDGQNQKDYVVSARSIARDALRRVASDFLTWDLARSVFLHTNDNFKIIENLVRQGGRVEYLWQRGAYGEHNLSVFTVRDMPGTYTAHRYGIDKTSMGFDDRVRSFRHGDPPDNTRVKEIEYDPTKIQSERIRKDQAQASQIERGQDQDRDQGGCRHSR